MLNTIVPLAVILVFEKKRQNMPNRARKVARPIMVSGRRNTRSLLLSYSYLSACTGTLLRLCALPVHALRQVIIIITIIIPTAPRIPPHHPSQREERRGVMSLVGQLLKSLSCLVAKLFSVLGCSLVE